MVVIIDITEYKKQKQEMLEEAKAELRRILEPLGTWESEEEEIRFHMELAELDKHEGII